MNWFKNIKDHDAWTDSLPLMAQSTGDLPRDVFPDAEDVAAAIALDELAAEVAKLAESEATEFMSDVEHRLNATFPTGRQSGRMS